MSRHLLAEQVVFGEGNLLIKSAQFAKFLRVEQHEHAGSEGPMPTRQVLKQIVAGVKQLVHPASVATQDICSYAMQVLALGEFHGATEHGRMCQFDIGIEKEHIPRIGEGRAVIAADRRHSATNNAEVQTAPGAK